MNISIIIFLFFFILQHPFQIYCALPKSETSVFGKKDSYGLNMVLQLIGTMQKKDSLFADQFFLRDEAMLDILKKKASEGITIEIAVNGEQKQDVQNANEVADAGVKVFIFNQNANIKNKAWQKLPVKLHEKTVGWTLGAERYTWSGSKNDTHKSKFNEEIMTLSTNEKIYESAYQEHLAILKHSVPLKDKNAIASFDLELSQVPLPKTPEMPRRVSSFEHDLAQSSAIRITNADNVLKMSLYGLDHESVKDALSSCAKNGVHMELCINYTLFKNSEKFIKELAEHGVNVYVYNHDETKKCGNFACDNHAKFLYREQKDGKTLVEIGSANPTKVNNADINHATLYPDDYELNKQILKRFDEIKKESVLLTKIPKYAKLKPKLVTLLDDKKNLNKNAD